jgi:hypothetical protein
MPGRREKIEFKTLCLCIFAPLRFAFLMITLNACVPPTLPPQLDDTPGAAVVITDQVYENEFFIVRYPDGWRVITGEAISPLSVIFAAPGDEGILIQLSLGELNQGDFEKQGMITDLRGVDLGEVQLTAIGTAPEEQWEQFLPIYERVLASIKAGN